MFFTGKVGMLHTHRRVGPNWTKPRFEIPKDGNTRTKRVRQPLLRNIVGVQPFLWISKWGLAHFGPTQWRVWRTPYLSSGPLNFENSARQKCILSFGGDCSVISNSAQNIDHCFIMVYNFTVAFVHICLQMWHTLGIVKYFQRNK